MNKLKISVEGNANLMSVYESNEQGERYFAQVQLCLEGFAKESNYPGEYGSQDNRSRLINGDSRVFIEMNLPITKLEYDFLKSQLDGEYKDLAYSYNDPIDRRPILKVAGNLEIALNLQYRVGKIHNIKNGLPYWVDKDKIKESV